MMWNLSFITEQDFTDHVKATIEKYGEKLESFDLKRFNKNIIDPIKLIFDKTVYQSTWDEIVSNEIFRQRDKSNNNDIGYFHQRIFQYIKNCHVPPNGEEGGWDVIYENGRVQHQPQQKDLQKPSTDRGVHGQLCGCGKHDTCRLCGTCVRQRHAGQDGKSGLDNFTFRICKRTDF